ncbi:MFS transporter [Pseudonocardia acaciae]|uniref:MFS transporter n=1 Tax=Pseudonocardia acaciae TaxID=551276 RepID=UPI00055D2FA1|nr:MFS transporter [Pseudonocardia acaciae]
MSQGIKPAAAVAVACIALFADMLVYGLAIPVLPLLPAVVAAGPTATGAMFAGYPAAVLLVTPIGGRLVDRYGPRRPLLIGMVGLAATTVLFAAGEPYWLLVLARVLQGVAGGMSWVAGLALIAAATPMATRGRSMGLAMSMVSLGVLAGPPLAGLLVERFNTTAPFLLAAGLALANGVAQVLLVRGHTPVTTDDPAGPLDVLRVRGSWSVVGAVVVGAGAIAAVEPVLPLHLTERFGMSALDLGLVFAAAVLAGAVVNPLVGGLVGRRDARVLVGVGVAGTVLALVGLALAGQAWQVWTAMAVLGAATACVLAPATTLIGFQGAALDPPALGGGYALFNLAYAAGLMLGPLLAGAGTDLVGLASALVGLAALAAVLGTAGIAGLPTGRGGPRERLDA